ncbi:MAG: hypothetical protein ACOYNL_08680, partial [Rickettsiales bacterium]
LIASKITPLHNRVYRGALNSKNESICSLTINTSEIAKIARAAIESTKTTHNKSGTTVSADDIAAICFKNLSEIKDKITFKLDEKRLNEAYAKLNEPGYAPDPKIFVKGVEYKQPMQAFKPNGYLDHTLPSSYQHSNRQHRNRTSFAAGEEYATSAVTGEGTTRARG